ncbi:unnamed protein product [Boreogadus saida]
MRYRVVRSLRPYRKEAPLRMWASRCLSSAFSFPSEPSCCSALSDRSEDVREHAARGKPHATGQAACHEANPHATGQAACHEANPHATSLGTGQCLFN